MRHPYRWALRAYPPAHRARHGEELVDTALRMHGGTWSPREWLGFVGGGIRLSLRTPRRFWWLAAGSPAAYALVQAMAIPSGAPRGTLALVTKLATVVSVPVLLVLLCERVAERPRRAAAAVGLWALLGVGSVLAVAAASPITRWLGSERRWRLWPDDENSVELLGTTVGADALGSWTVERVIVQESLGMIGLAMVAGVALWSCARRDPLRAGWLVPVSVFSALLVYRTATPWSFVLDYDTFVGDAVLGAMVVELAAFFAPTDPIAGTAVGVAALSMAALLQAWGGPMATRRPVRRAVRRFVLQS